MKVAVPPVSTPPVITKDPTANCRVYFDCNCTPFLKKTADDWYQIADADYYMHQLGFDKMMMVYIGTINNTTTWSEKGVPFDVPYVNRRFVIDPKRSGSWADYEAAEDPVAAKAQLDYVIKALRALAAQPNRYGGLAEPGVPLVVDIEHTATFNRHPASIKDELATAKKWQDLLIKFRGENIRNYEALYAYGYWRWEVAMYWDGHKPTMATDEWKEFVEVEDQNSRILSGAMISLYNWQQTEWNPSLWFQNVMRAESILSRYYPHWMNNRIAVIRPVLGNHRPLLPLSRWKAQVDFLVARGWHLFLWWDSPVPFADAKGHIDYVARYHK